MYNQLLVWRITHVAPVYLIGLIYSLAHGSVYIDVLATMQQQTGRECLGADLMFMGLLGILNVFVIFF